MKPETKLCRGCRGLFPVHTYKLRMRKRVDSKGNEVMREYRESRCDACIRLKKRSWAQAAKLREMAPGGPRGVEKVFFCKVKPTC